MRRTPQDFYPSTEKAAPISPLPETQADRGRSGGATDSEPLTERGARIAVLLRGLARELDQFGAASGEPLEVLENWLARRRAGQQSNGYRSVLPRDIYETLGHFADSLQRVELNVDTLLGRVPERALRLPMKFDPEAALLWKDADEAQARGRVDFADGSHIELHETPGETLKSSRPIAWTEEDLQEADGDWDELRNEQAGVPTPITERPTAFEGGRD